MRIFGLTAVCIYHNVFITNGLNKLQIVWEIALVSTAAHILCVTEAAMGVPHLQPSEPSESTESPSAPRKAKKQAQKRLNEAHDSAVEESFTSDSSITDDETEEESPVTAIRALFE